MDISLLNVLSEALNRLNIPKDDIIFSSHTESFVYYAMNQKQELWTNDVALFDYGDNGLVYKLMSIIPFRDQNNPHKVLDFYKFHHLGLTPILLKHSLEEEAAMKAELEAINFFERCNK